MIDLNLNKCEEEKGVAPQISVIVPSFNYERFLKETIESILNQTFQDFEVIVVDDGSKDSSMSILKHINKSHRK